MARTGVDSRDDDITTNFDDDVTRGMCDSAGITNGVESFKVELWRGAKVEGVVTGSDVSLTGVAGVLKVVSTGVGCCCF